MSVRSKVCEVISASKLGIAQQCPMKFYWQYIERIPSIKSWKPHAGATVDAGLNYGYSCQAKSGKLEPLDAIEDASREEFNRIKDVVDFEGLKPNSVFSKCRLILNVFHTEIMPTVEPGIENNTPLVQHKVESFVKPLGTRVLGYIDLVEENGTVVDNKTSYNKRWQKNVLVANKQAGIYSFLRKLDTGSIPKVRFDVVSALKTKTVADRLTVDVDQLYIDKVLNEQKTVLNYIDQAAANYERTGDRSLFYCNTSSPLCSKRYCSFAYMCESELGLEIKD